MPQIISAGLPKTGTRTLMRCLRELGYTHSGDAFQQRRLLDWCAGNWVFDPQDVQDEPAFAFWRQLADAEPRAKVIMTVRAFEPWRKSCDWLRTPKRLGPPTEKRRELDAMLARFEQPRTPTLEFLLGLVGGGLDLEFATLRHVWATHEVSAYSRALPQRLLVWDLTQDSRWEPLCAFLDRPVPAAPFPWENRTLRTSEPAGEGE